MEGWKVKLYLSKNNETKDLCNTKKYDIDEIGNLDIGSNIQKKLAKKYNGSCMGDTIKNPLAYLMKHANQKETSDKTLPFVATSIIAMIKIE